MDEKNILYSDEWMEKSIFGDLHDRDLRHRSRSKDALIQCKMVYIDNSYDQKDQEEKTDVLAEVLHTLRKVLDALLCCITCGCYPACCKDETDDYACNKRYRNNRRKYLACELNTTRMRTGERLAVQELIDYLASDENKEIIITEARLHALSILTFSGSKELQKYAALCFVEISEAMILPVSPLLLEPLVSLLRSTDTQIQKSASLAFSNFALNGPESNKLVMLNIGILNILLSLLESSNTEVQCNACGCITTMATNDKVKRSLVSIGGISQLLKMTNSIDIRVKRNASGAILNITHLQMTRRQLVDQGAIPMLVQLLHSNDSDVQHYCAAALSNIAVNIKYRTMMVAVGRYDVLVRLVELLRSPRDKVKCQVCLALRNLACDVDNQLLIVRCDVLPALHNVMKQSRGETLSAAVATLRNLSIHKSNENCILRQDLLDDLNTILSKSSNPTAQLHAAGTIRNLAAGEHVQVYIELVSSLHVLLDVFMLEHTKLSVLEQVTAALAVLIDQDNSKPIIMKRELNLIVKRLVLLSESSPSSDLRYNCAGFIGQLTLYDPPIQIIDDMCLDFIKYLISFISTDDDSVCHIALWTMVQLLKYNVFLTELKENSRVFIPLLNKHIQENEDIETMSSASTSELILHELSIIILSAIKQPATNQ